MIKQALAILLSIIIAIYPPLAYANAPTSWTATKVNAVGSTTFVEAVKGNKKSLAKIAPTAGMVGKFLRSANGLSLLHSTVSTLLDGVDWVMTDGSAIKYKDSAQGFEYIFHDKSFTSAEEACNYAKSDEFLKPKGYFYARLSSIYGEDRGKYYQAINHYNNAWSFNCTVSVSNLSFRDQLTPSGWKQSWSGHKYAKGEIIEKTLPIEAVAQQAIAQAKQGNKEAQAGIEQAVREAIKAGTYNNILQTNAVLINGEDGLAGENGKDGVDGKDAPPLDVSSITNAISSLANRISSSFDRLAGKQDQIISEQQTTTRVINTQTDEILERQKQTKIAIDEMLVQGKLVNTNIDRVIDELRTNKDVTKVGLDNIHDALEKGLSGELINSKIDEAIEQAKINNKNATDAFKDAINKQLEAQARENEKVVSSIKDIESAIAELQRQQEQARAEAKTNTDRIVEAIESLKEEAQEEQEIEKQEDTEIEIEEPELPLDSVKVNFSKTCPPDKQIPFSLVGKQMNITISYANLCQLAIGVSWLVKVLSTVMAAYILTGIKS